MIAWWIAQIALLGTLLAVAARGAEAALSAARKPTRWAWIAALVMTVVLGALAPTRLATGTAAERIWQPTGTGTTIQSIPASETALSLIRAAWHDASELFATAIQRGWDAWHNTMPSAIGGWLLIAWALTSAALLTLYVGVHVRYQLRRAQWPLGSVHGTTVRIANDTGPAVIGVTSAEIVLPHWLLARGNREQELVLAHEMEHVRAHDPVLLAMAQVAVVLLPWHPAVWWMASRLRLAIELDCDRRVLQRGASARDYGTLLIDLTDHRAGFGVALPAFSCRPSHLERRLVAMTPKRLRYPLIRVLAAGAMASLAVLAACEAKLPTSDEMDRMTASSATAAAGRVAMIVRCPVKNSRELLRCARLTPEEGLPGDKWGANPSRDPEAQLTVMQRDVAELVANGQSLALFGDNLFVDLDLSVANLPIGSRLRVGAAVVEVTPMPHDGCSKFKARFGADALRFVNTKETRHLNLRGIYWRVIEAGDVAVGDAVNVLTRGPKLTPP